MIKTQKVNNKFGFLLTDVDDTLTTHGKLLPDTYQALWRLNEAGVKVIPVTGGCAGWCDHMIRAWPVDAVIGEGGAFYLTKSSSGYIRREFWGEHQQHQLDQRDILLIVEQLMNVFPIQLAKDQCFRWVDVALDYNQDCKLSDAQLSAILTELSKHEDLQVKKSSIHLNIVKGNFDKAGMARRLLFNEYRLTKEELSDQVMVIGDAPNDESLFQWFPNSAAVANIKPHLDAMTYKPNSIMTAASGAGFVEFVDWFLCNR